MKKAVTFGRYNLVTLSHLSTIIEILKKWDYLVVLIVSNDLISRNEPVAELGNFYRLCEQNHMKSKNIFTLKERKTMFNKMLFDYNLTNLVKVDFFARPELNYVEFNQKYHQCEYDLVFPRCNSNDGEFDKIRNDSFQKILNREIYTVNPACTVHTKEIVTFLRNAEDINNYLSPGVCAYLKEISGEERLLNLYKTCR